MIRINLFLLAVVVSLCFLSCVPTLTFRDSWLNDSFIADDIGPERESILVTARKYLGTRYRRGGSSPSGFDCSGFVQYVFAKNGITLPRSAKNQFKAGRPINYEGMRPGDLLFFKIDRTSISHVAIYVGGNRFIHAPSSGKKVSYSSMYESWWQQTYVGSVALIE
ncbi:MAG TPA: C40 family peptidase [Spirochaetota bacterium]|nr:C40 family peptidase [Spirochaetota bacterium]HPI89290.1 C40 family peptidase [Spirochaetota bacterium]HPR47888.1 C40 family peptidase [Spirochaetota bacterium]